MLALTALLAILAPAAPTARAVVQSAPAPTVSVAVSADGYVATLGADDSLRIWQLETRTLLRTFAGWTWSAHGGVVHPAQLAWDAAAHTVMLAGGNGRIAVGVDGTVQDRGGAGERWLPIHGGWLTSHYGTWARTDADGAPAGSLAAKGDVAISGDGTSALVVTPTGFARVDLATNTETPIPLAGAPPAGQDGSMTNATVAWSRDGKVALACTGTETAAETVVRVDLASPKHTATPIALPDAPIGCHVAISDDGATGIVAALGVMHGIDLATGARRWTVALPFVAASTVGTSLVVRGRLALVTPPDGHTLLFDVARGDAVGELGSVLTVPGAIAFGAGDVVVATSAGPPSIFGASPTHFAIWTLADGALATRGEVDWGLDFRVRADGQLAVVRALANNCFAFSLGTTRDGAPTGTPRANAWPPKPGDATSLCLAAGERAVAVDPLHGHVLVAQRMATGDYYSLRGFNGGNSPLTAPQGVALDRLLYKISRDGGTVLGWSTQGSIGTLYTWDIHGGAPTAYTASPSDPAGMTLDGSRKGFWAADVSDDGAQIAVASEDTVTIYALHGKKPVRTATTPAHTAISAVAFVPGGLALGLFDGRLAISRAGAPLALGAASDTGAVSLVAGRADGKRIATVSDDGAIRVWDARTATTEAALVEFADGESIALTPGGAYAGAREAAARLAWVFDGRGSPPTGSAAEGQRDSIDSPVEGFAFEAFAAQLAHADLVAQRLRDAHTDVTATLVRPPRVTLAGAVPASVTADRVRLVAHVETTTGGGEVRAFVDGRAVASQPLGTGGGAQDVPLDIPLGGGTNGISVVAFDASGRASNPATAEIAAPATSARPEVWVVAAGVGWYPSLPDGDQLEAPVADAHAIADAFAARAGDGKPFAAAHVTILEDLEVTPAAIEDALSGLRAMKPNDIAIVFLAGHGTQVGASHDMVLVTSAATLDPKSWGATGIGWPAVAKHLQAAKGRVIVLLDACHSGAVTQELVVPNSQLAERLVSGERAGALVFAASKGRQDSLEDNAARGLVLDDDQQKIIGHKKLPPRPRPPAAAPPPPPPPVIKTAMHPRRGEGYFTAAVLAALESPSTDTNGDGVIEASGLVAQVTLRVTRASRGRQTPWVARRELFGDFAVTAATK